MDGCKVAMVAACPFPANYGSPGAIREMALSLASRASDIHIVTYPFGEDLPVDGLTIWRCSWWRKKRVHIYSGPSIEKLFLDLFLLVKLCRVIRQQKIELIHAHNYEGVVLGFAAKLLTGRPLLYNAVNLMSDELHLYGFLRPRFLARALARLLDYLVMRWPDAFIAITDDLRRAMLARGVSAERIAMVPCGVDLKMFEKPHSKNLATQYKLGDRPVVMYTGINSPIQRLDYLLRAFSLVRREVPGVLLMIVSPLEHDPDLQANRALALDLGVQSDVIWVEGHKLTDLPAYLALASAAVISRPDMPGHPIKLLNYMAAARPIVCSEGAAKGVRHLHDAFVTRDHHWQGLAEGIITLLQNPMLASELGRNAKATVIRDFDCARLCTPVENMYRFLTANGSYFVNINGVESKTSSQRHYSTPEHHQSTEQQAE
jgi:1,2-diacylglycerol 3-alpha-glucosyltransferase